MVNCTTSAPKRPTERIRESFEMNYWATQFLKTTARHHRITFMMWEENRLRLVSHLLPLLGHLQ